MLISDALWAKIRDRFTEEEKELLRGAFCGETICPRGVVVDEEKLKPGLLRALAEAKRGAL